MKLTYEDSIQNLDPRCRHCKHMVLGWNHSRDSRGGRNLVRRCDCRLSISQPHDLDKIRGYCGSANPDKCNNGTKEYRNY